MCWGGGIGRRKGLKIQKKAFEPSQVNPVIPIFFNDFFCFCVPLCSFIFRYLPIKHSQLKIVHMLAICEKAKN